MDDSGGTSVGDYYDGDSSELVSGGYLGEDTEVAYAGYYDA